MTAFRSAPDRLARCIHGFHGLLGSPSDEEYILDLGRALLAELVSEDDWLPPEYARPSTERYTQYLLYSDSSASFSISSFVWGPGQGTPVHDHTVWGLVGVLRGGEVAQRFELSGDSTPVAMGRPRRFAPGAVDAVSPSVGDIHQVTNAFADRVSISIHVYGGDIGAISRSVYLVGGGRKPFVSTYANDGLTPPFKLDGAG